MDDLEKLFVLRYAGLSPTCDCELCVMLRGFLDSLIFESTPVPLPPQKQELPPPPPPPPVVVDHPKPPEKKIVFNFRRK